MKHVLARPIVFTLLRVRISGTRHIPRSGPVILASNHRSYFDSVVLPLVLRRRVHFLTATEYFGGQASDASLQIALGMLAKGKLLAIYPEGSRSRDGRLHRGRTGVARLAYAANAVVVPVGIRGTDDVLPNGGPGPRVRLAPVRIAFGPPVPLPPVDGA